MHFLSLRLSRPNPRSSLSASVFGNNSCASDTLYGNGKRVPREKFAVGIYPPFRIHIRHGVHMRDQFGYERLVFFSWNTFLFKGSCIRLFFDPQRNQKDWRNCGRTRSILCFRLSGVTVPREPDIVGLIAAYQRLVEKFGAGFPSWR